MSTAPRIAVTTNRRPPPAAGGFTLLEVLVSLGVIIGALAGIAAILPATGSRLAEAVQTDRAATMAANARADLLSRGLISKDLWSGGSAIVFGAGLTSGGSPTVPHATISAANSGAVSARIDPTTGFELRDVVKTTVTGVTVLTRDGYESSICYGCMLSSSTAPSGRGAPVRMTTVVFRKPNPAVQSFTLMQTGSGSKVLVSGSGVTAAALRRQYLPGCSWILAVGSGEPRWVQIASSWTAGPGEGTSYVSLSGSDWGNLLTSGTVLQAFGFEGLLQIDERSVNLQ